MLHESLVRIAIAAAGAVQHPLSYIDALGLLEEEAARLDKEGRHIKAKLMRAEARGMQEENPLHTGAVRPPQNSGEM